MKRNLNKSFLVVLALFMNFNSNGQSTIMNFNGRKVEVLATGLENNRAGKPVIVFENGRGSTFNSWETIINEISKDHAVFAYNRPRIGLSEDDGIPPSMKYTVDNLRSMLKEKGLEPPYLLIGHSFGACYIRSFASYYPNEVAGLIFVDPHDFTKKEGYGRLPYQEIGLSEQQIDSLFASYEYYGEQFILNGPKHHVEEVKIQGDLAKTGHEECNRIPLPDIPVHFIVAGGFTLYPDEAPTIYDREKLFRVDSNIKMKRWLELLYPLKYGRLFYDSNAGHAVQIDNPDLVISSIRMALADYNHLFRVEGVAYNNGPVRRIFHQVEQDQLDSSVVQMIKEYYHLIYGEGTRLEESAEAAAGEGARLEESAEASTIQLTYYSIPDIEEESEGRIVTITIPLTKEWELYGAIPILEGDLNNDRKSDLVITVHTEFGNSASQDLFLFINENERYRLATVASHQEISGCRGTYWARKIKDNLIEGISSCYSADDAMCCPSLHYKTKVAFDANALKVLSKKRMR